MLLAEQPSSPEPKPAHLCLQPAATSYAGHAAGCGANRAAGRSRTPSAQAVRAGGSGGPFGQVMRQVASECAASSRRHERRREAIANHD
ncbi:unnamed protein product [[Actinomadura] parvosata subsp. kistnae]|nr:unnamed protein product [Actinomadura parvosata subsp. kistnae]